MSDEIKSAPKIIINSDGVPSFITKMEELRDAGTFSLGGNAFATLSQAINILCTRTRITTAGIEQALSEGPFCKHPEVEILKQRVFEILDQFATDHPRLATRIHTPTKAATVEPRGSFKLPPLFPRREGLIVVDAENLQAFLLHFAVVETLGNDQITITYKPHNIDNGSLVKTLTDAGFELPMPYDRPTLFWCNPSTNDCTLDKEGDDSFRVVSGTFCRHHRDGSGRKFDDVFPGVTLTVSDDGVKAMVEKFHPDLRNNIRERD